MSTIQFGPLQGSPETLADAAAPLPPLSGLAVEQAGDFSFGRLPALRSVAAGTLREAGMSAGVLPAWFGFGRDIPGGYSTGRLPALVGTSYDTDDLLPPSGFVLTLLPALTLSAELVSHEGGRADATLPQLRSVALETAGDYGVARLPALIGGGYQQFVVTNYLSLLQAPGLLYMTAGTLHTGDLEAAAESSVFGDSLAYTPLRDLLFALDSATPTGVAWALRAAAQTLPALAGAVLRAATLQDQADAGDRLAAVYQAFLSAGADAGTSVEGMVRRLAVAQAVAFASAPLAGWKHARAEALAAALAADLLRLAHVGELTSNADVDAALAASMRQLAALESALVPADALDGALRFVVVPLVDRAPAQDSLEAWLRLFAALDTQAFTAVSLSLGDDEFTGWALTTSNRALSQYDHYPFTGFAQHGGRYYGVAADGVYLLDGDDDNGTPVSAAVRTALMNFGTAKHKRLPAVYLAYRSPGPLALKVVTTSDTGAPVERWYRVRERPTTALRETRVDIGRGLRSVYWQLELVNTDGADFDLDTMTLVPMILTRRL